MSENTLINKIAADSDVEVSKIKADVETELSAIKRDTDSKLATLEAEAKARLQKLKQQIELVETSKAKQAQNIAIQKAKREKVDEIFDAVAAEFVAMSDKEYVDFFVRKGSELVPKDIKVTAVETPAGKTEEAKDILEALGLKADLTESTNLSAGLIIHAEDGVYDLSFDRMFQEKKGALEIEVVKQVMS